MPIINVRLEGSWLIIEHNELTPPLIDFFLNEAGEICVSDRKNNEVIKIDRGDTLLVIEHLLDRRAFLTRQIFGETITATAYLTDVQIAELKNMLDAIPSPDGATVDDGILL